MPEQLVDACGYPVPAALEDVWQARDVFQETLGFVRKIRSRIRKLKDPEKGLARGGQFLDAEANYWRCQHLYASIAGSMPDTVCDYCLGACQDPEDVKQTCPSCLGSGFHLHARRVGPAATINQVRMLKRYGRDALGLRQKEASRIIEDIIAQNGREKRDV